MKAIPIVEGLSALASRYEALVCDVWGVIHNGRVAYPGVAEALARFRKERGPVVLLTNAPRPWEIVAGQLRHFGVPDDAYDAIVTSGDLTREEILARASQNGGQLQSLYIGPDRDLGIFDAQTVGRVGLNDADIIICTGPYKDEEETPEDYRAVLTLAARRALPMICANPDLRVQRGAQLIYCAGALAALYEELGGMVWYAGKPHLPVYEKVDRALAMASGSPLARSKALMVGDGLKTDILGANRAGLDCLLITGGVHASDFGESADAPEADRVASVLHGAELTAVAATARLRW